MTKRQVVWFCVGVISSFVFLLPFAYQPMSISENWLTQLVVLASPVLSLLGVFIALRKLGVL